MVGYGVPLAIVLIMGIGENHKDLLSVLWYVPVELSVDDECHVIKPKFGIE